MDLQDKSFNDKNCFVDSGDPDKNVTCISVWEVSG
jgi:hypothetical protein